MKVNVEEKEKELKLKLPCLVQHRTTGDITDSPIFYAQRNNGNGKVWCINLKSGVSFKTLVSDLEPFKGKITLEN